MVSLKSLFGDSSAKVLKTYGPKVEEVNALEAEISALGDEALKGKTSEFKKRLAEGETLEQILPEAFAVVREAAKRTVKQRPFDVQLIGGMIIHEGKIAEMKTGEGKTLVATLPSYLNALTGKGVHIVTVNDYLSRRDAVWMGEIYSFLGLSVGVINHDSSYIYDPTHRELDEKRDEVAAFKVVYEFLRPCSRTEAYNADITYGTNNEFGFDYLRDNIEYDIRNLRQRPYNFAIVDEVDSILIDEARTPLIISMPTTESEDLYGTFASIARKMEKEKHFTVDEKLRAITLTDEGIDLAEKLLGVENIYTEKGIKYVHHLETAVRARALFERDKDYVIKDNEVIIVDEFTGRLQHGRRWSEGLHQAVEAKEGVRVQKESRTYASITFQNYFRLYEKLSGMTGTAKTNAEEFFKVYGLEVIEVPTNKPVVRKDANDLIFQTEKGKFMAIAKKIKELNEAGQPVLVGTVSIEKNELLSAYLKREGIQHQILNAKPEYAEREGEIIAEAGKRKAVTISTNMAGRGVDIKLGGAIADSTESEEVKNLGGLFVLGTERHEARRIDNQLRGRSGRQGDPGTTQFFVSLEDSLMRIFATDTIKNMMGRFGIPEDQPIENRLITRALENAQTKIEGFNFDARKHVLEYDDVLNSQRKVVYERRRKILMGNREDIEEFLNEVKSEATPEELEKIEKKKTELGEEQFYQALRRLFMQTIDLFWVDHLEVMDYMRSSVNLRAYGQRDPLVEYKREGLRLFKEMQQSINLSILEAIPNMGSGQFAFSVQVPTMELKPQASPLNVAGANSAAPASSTASHLPKIGRNDPCFCGSGKKFKNCGLKNTEEHQKLINEGK
ncbi:MAG TPA: preprotein translocase subunit SecA [Candidatus Paceibacterota bacterium]|nr:preprotein translocase subunit SecA [Candidatus Paceibacterota bacterium]